MKKTLLKKIALGMAMVMTMAATAGCGAQTAEAPATEAPAAEAPAAEGTETPAADDASAFETIEAGKLIAGTNAAFPPFEYIGDDGTPDGFDIALIRAIGDKLGLEVTVNDMEFSSLVSSIGSKIDVAIAGMTVTEERQQMVDFSNSYYEAVQYVIMPAGAEYKEAADLEGKNIGVQLGTTGDFIAQDITGATVNSYDKAVDAVNDLVNGRNDIVIIDKNPALVFETNFEGKVVAVPGSDFGFEAEQYAIALPKDSALTDAVNKALEEIKADGTFDALVKEYIEEY